MSKWRCQRMNLERSCCNSLHMSITTKFFHKLKLGKLGNIRMDLMTSKTCLFVKLKYAIKNWKLNWKMEILLRLLPISNDFHSKESSLSVLDRKEEERLMGLLLLLVRKERGLLLGTAGSLLTCNLVWISVHPTLHLAKTTSSSPLLLAVSFIPIRRAVHPFSRNVQ